MSEQNDRYVLTQRDVSTPYFKRYVAAHEARLQREANREPLQPSQYFEEPEEEVKVKKTKKVKKSKVKRQRTKGTMKRARRGFMVFLVMLFALLYVAVGALSFLQLDMLSDYNKYFDLFTKVEETVPATDETDAEYTYTSITLEDVVMSFAKMIMGDGIEGEYIFYNECLATIEAAETMDMIAFYALPVVFVLGIVIALIFFVRALVSLCTPKRRKLFVLSSILMLILSVLGIFCGFLWSGLEFAEIMVYLNVLTPQAPMQVGYGSLIMTVLSLLALIASLFAFRSKKKVK